MTGLIVNEWIEAAGGAERVLSRLATLFPDADLLCLWNDDPTRFPDRTVRETWLARTPLRRHKALALPVMPITWRLPRQTTHDWTLVSSHAFAHHVRVEGDGPKYVYVHTPARYLWAPELDQRGDNLAVRIAGPPLRALDKRTAAQCDRPRRQQPLRRRSDRTLVGTHRRGDPSARRCRGDRPRGLARAADRCRAAHARRAPRRLRARGLPVHPVQAARHRDPDRRTPGPAHRGGRVRSARGGAARAGRRVAGAGARPAAAERRDGAGAHGQGGAVRLPPDRGLRHRGRRGDGGGHARDGQPRRRRPESPCWRASAARCSIRAQPRRRSRPRPSAQACRAPASPSTPGDSTPPSSIARSPHG